MAAASTNAQKLRFYSQLVVVYALTLLVGWFAVRPHHAFASNQAQLSRQQQLPHVPVIAHAPAVSGRPVRIVIPNSGIDLPVDEGFYNSADGSWTLSGYHAQFAMISTLANNRAGETFIYGHNNNYVFGALRHVTPAAGALALLYTDNGHIFAYTFTAANSVGPDDVSTLAYNGPPVLVIQTCTGSLNEWRTMYHFNFDKVVQ